MANPLLKRATRARLRASCGSSRPRRRRGFDRPATARSGLPRTCVPERASQPSHEPDYFGMPGSSKSSFSETKPIAAGAAGRQKNEEASSAYGCPFEGGTRSSNPSSSSGEFYATRFPRLRPRLSTHAGVLIPPTSAFQCPSAVSLSARTPARHVVGVVNGSPAAGNGDTTCEMVGS